MTAIGFLMDEHVPLIIRARLEQLEPEMRLYAVGDDIAPPKGTPDSDLLAWIEANDCLLVTNNRATIPVHLRHHLAAGGHVPGVLVIPRQRSIQLIVDWLRLISGASLTDEYRDQIVYLPSTA